VSETILIDKIKIDEYRPVWLIRSYPNPNLEYHQSVALTDRELTELINRLNQLDRDNVETIRITLKESE
jgi:hypothetical protein